MSDFVLSPTIQAKVDRVEAKIRKAEFQIEQWRKDIDRLACVDSPIKPNDIITFESSGRIRTGKVISMRSLYYGYEYRVLLQSKAGKAIGYARVTSDKCPTLVGKE
jgi:hypothetical protein